MEICLCSWVVKEPKELQFISEQGVEIIPIVKILTELQNQEKLDFTTGAATDIIELIQLLNIKSKQINIKNKGLRTTNKVLSGLQGQR